LPLTATGPVPSTVTVLPFNVSEVPPSIVIEPLGPALISTLPSHSIVSVPGGLPGLQASVSVPPTASRVRPSLS
jgi:hypothetical protein